MEFSYSYVAHHTTHNISLTVMGLLGLPVLTMHAILVALRLIEQDQGILHRYHMCTEDHLEIQHHCFPLLLVYIKSVTTVIITSNVPSKKMRLPVVEIF